MSAKLLIVFGLMTASLIGSAKSQDCRRVGAATFTPQDKTISLLRAGTSTNIIFFRTKLRVNTDGAPNSYHPEDPRGATKAINNIANGVTIYRNGKKLKYADTIRVFEDWRDNGYRDPPGYRFSWRNVLAARPTSGGGSAPCTFSAGPFSGYFVSLTALKNRLPPSQAGECGANNQLDERLVPALVLAGGQTPMAMWGARTGDLVIARNPANNVSVAAVIGDTGPDDNLGEGAVALNMQLLGRTTQPRTYEEAKQLDTGATIIDVAVFPKTAAYHWQAPVSAANLRDRLDLLLSERSLGLFDKAMATFSACARPNAQ